MSGAAPRVLHGATSGQQVAVAQRALKAAGYDPGPVDSVYGPLMAKAVRAFQQDAGLESDGVIGERTWRALVTKPRDGRTPHSKDPLDRRLSGMVSGEDVARLQRSLRDLGLFRAPVDSLYGPQTERAVLAFQRQAGLTVDGLVGPETWAALDEGAAAPDGHLDGGEVDSRPSFVGFASDRRVTSDALGRRAHVDLLCSVLAAKGLETPLAVGLFGDWGSGKSFFMRMMQEQITTTSDLSLERERTGQPTFYCSHVVQVMFNAWLHADAAMWPSLAAKVFRSVSGIDDDVPPPSTQVAERTGYQKALEDEYRSQRMDERTDAALRDEVEAVEARLAEREAALRRQLTDLRTSTPTATVLTVADETARTWGFARRLSAVWSDLNGRERAQLVVLPVLAVAIVALALLRPAWSQAVAALSVSLAGAVAVALPILRVAREAGDVLALRAQRGALAEQVQAARERADARARDQSPGVSPLLREYVQEQASRWNARQGSGDLTEIRQAFERLSALISERHAAQARPAGGAGPLPIDRVVVYIDDLDRCPPPQVVSVLSAINLLLDLPHFVVVVGVDSRWLFRSLDVEFTSLLGGGAGDADDERSATPQHYLEKIFQYPVVLPPLTGEGFAHLVEELLPPGHEPAPAGSRDADDRPPTGHARESRGAEPGNAGSSSHEKSPARTPNADMDLTPRDLVISQEERECIGTLAPLFQTPRAVKRLTNLYRLVRVSVGEPVLLEQRAYRKVLLLLALSISLPHVSSELFRTIDSDGTLRESLEQAAQGAPASAARVLDLVGSPAWRDVAAEPASGFAPWVGVVAQFSFHPWRGTKR